MRRPPPCLNIVGGQLRANWTTTSSSGWHKRPLNSTHGCRDCCGGFAAPSVRCCSLSSTLTWTARATTEPRTRSRIDRFCSDSTGRTREARRQSRQSDPPKLHNDKLARNLAEESLGLPYRAYSSGRTELTGRVRLRQVGDNLGPRHNHSHVAAKSAAKTVSTPPRRRFDWPVV